MEKLCIALYKRLLLALLLITLTSCYTIKSTVVDFLDKTWPAKYWYEQKRVQDSVPLVPQFTKQNKTNHHSLSNLDSLHQPQYRL
jgi:hypothetical protein